MPWNFLCGQVGLMLAVIFQLLPPQCRNYRYCITVLIRVSIVVKRHHDHSNTHKENIGQLIVSEV